MTMRCLRNLMVSMAIVACCNSILLTESRAATMRVDFNGTAIWGAYPWNGDSLTGSAYEGFFTFDTSIIGTSAGYFSLPGSNVGYETTLHFNLTGMSRSFDETSASLCDIAFFDGALWNWSLGGVVGGLGDVAWGIALHQNAPNADFQVFSSGIGYYSDYLLFPEPGGQLSTPTWSVSEQKPVPAPATMLLLGSGLAGLAGLRRKFR